MNSKLIRFILSLCTLVLSFTELPADNGLYSPEDKKIAIENFNRLIEQNAWNDANGLSHRNVYVFSLSATSDAFDCALPLLCRGNSYLKTRTLRKLNEQLRKLALSPAGIEFYLGLDGKRFKVTDGKKQKNPALAQETLEEIKTEIENHFTTLFNDSRVHDRSVLLTFSLIDNLVIYDPESGFSDQDKLRQIPYGYILKGPAFSKASLTDTYRASMAVSGALDEKVEKLVNNTITYLKDYLNLPYRGAGRDFFAQYGKNATGEELEQIKAIASLYEQMGDLLLEDYSEKAWQSQKPCYRVLYDGFGHWGYSWEQYREFLQNYCEEFQTLSTELAKIPSRHRAVILLKNLSDKQLQSIPLDTRLHALKTLVSESMYGHWNLLGENEEALALRLLQHLPDDPQHIYGLLNKLMENHTIEQETLPLLEFLNKRFNDLEWLGGDGNYAVLSMTLAEKYLSLKQQEEMLALVKQVSEKDQVFRWNSERFGPNFYNSKFENGLLHFSYREVSGLQEDIRGNYSIQYTPRYTQKEFTLPAFELVSVILEEDMPALKATKGQVLFVPAITLAYLLEEQSNEQVRTYINQSIDLLSLAFGAAEIKAGVKGLKLGLALVDVSVTAGDLMVSVLEQKITQEYGAEGEAFLRSWHMVSGVASMANLGTQNISMLVEVMPAEVGKMRAFWSTYKDDPRLKQILGKDKHQKLAHFVKGAQNAYTQSGHKLRTMAEDMAALANSKIDSWYAKARLSLRQVKNANDFTNVPAALLNFTIYWTLKQSKEITKAAFITAYRKDFPNIKFKDGVLESSYNIAQRLTKKVGAEMYTKLKAHGVTPHWLADVLDKGVDSHKLDKVLGELLVNATDGKSGVLALIKNVPANRFDTVFGKFHDFEDAATAEFFKRLLNDKHGNAQGSFLKDHLADIDEEILDTWNECYKSGKFPDKRYDYAFLDDNRGNTIEDFTTLNNRLKKASEYGEPFKTWLEDAASRYRSKLINDVYDLFTSVRDNKLDEYIAIYKNDEALSQKLLELKNKSGAITKEEIRQIFKGYHAHHIIPVNLIWNSDVLRDILAWAYENGKTFDFNTQDNLIFLHEINHLPNGRRGHNDYDKIIDKSIQELEDLVESQGYKKAFNQFTKIIEETRTAFEKEYIGTSKDINNF